MKKRLVSMLLALVMVLGMLPVTALAAGSEEEALGEVNIYNGEQKLSYLSINGRIRELIYTYFNHVDANGRTKEIPAYCVNPNTTGVPQTVAPGESIKYIAKEKGNDPKVMGIIANGYPTRGLSELKLENKYHAYYATKMALWCYLLPNWNINNLKVNPNLTGAELQRAQAILAAAKDIYVRGTAWNKIYSPRVTAAPDRDTAYAVTVDGQQYKQQVFTVHSDTWVCNYAIRVAFSDPASIPAGARIVDMNNKDITTITTSGTGDGYGGKFKVLYPAAAVAGKTGSAQLSFTTDVYKYVSKTQKLAMLSRLLPFVEKRINLIELAPKETGKSKAAIKNAREEIAKCINAKPSEIFFTSGGTESDNWAIKGCAFADESKRATITSTIEHHAVLRSCQFIERLGYPVTYINPNSNGLITVEMLEQVIAGTTNLVSVATANNEIGTIQPINKLAEIAHRNGAFFHTDAVQAMGHIPVDVNELNVDLLSASAHKFNGPKGIGFLYVRERTPILPLLNGGAQENSLRAGTENVASIVGMATALSMNCSQMQKSQNQSAKMIELICSILNDAEVDYIRNGYSNRLKGILNLSFHDKDGEAILHRLDLRGILVSTGSACDSNSTQVSHVIRAINVPDSYAKGTIRISLGKDNTLEEAKIIGETLVSVLME